MRAMGFADSEALAAKGEACPFLAQEHAGEDAVVVKVEEGDNQLWEVREKDVGKVSAVRGAGDELGGVRGAEANVTDGGEVSGSGREEGDALNSLRKEVDACYPDDEASGVGERWFVSLKVAFTDWTWGCSIEVTHKTRV